MDVKLNQKFQNRKNGRIAHVERLDEKAKTVILMYDDEKGGYSQNMTFITLGKSYKRVEDEVVEPATEEANAIVNDFEQSEEVASDGTPYAEVMEEIQHDEVVAVEQTKEKKQKKEKKAAEKPKKERKKKEPEKNWIDPISIVVEFLDSKKIEYVHKDDRRIRLYDVDKKIKMIICRRKTAIRIYTKDVYFDRIKDSANLYWQNGGGCGNLTYSFYVGTEAINEALEKLFKED